jgi:hypothetical protein
VACLESADVVLLKQKFDKLQQLSVIVAAISLLSTVIDRCIEFTPNLRYVQLDWSNLSDLRPEVSRPFASVKRLLDSIPSIEWINLDMCDQNMDVILHDAESFLEPKQAESSSCPQKMILKHSNIFKKIFFNGWNLWEVIYICLGSSDALSDHESLADGFVRFCGDGNPKLASLAQLSTILAEPDVLATESTRPAALWFLSTFESLLQQEKRFGLGRSDILLSAMAAYGLAVAINHPNAAGFLQWCRSSLSSMKDPPELFSLLEPIFYVSYNFRRPCVIDAAVDLGMENFLPLTPTDDEDDAEATAILIGLLYNPKFKLTDPQLLQTAFQRFVKNSQFPRAFTHAGNSKQTMSFLLQKSLELGVKVPALGLNIQEPLAMELLAHSKYAPMLARFFDSPTVALKLLEFDQEEGGVLKHLEWVKLFLAEATSQFPSQEVESVAHKVASPGWREYLRILQRTGCHDLPRDQVDPTFAALCLLPAKFDPWKIPHEIQIHLSARAEESRFVDVEVSRWLKQQMRLFVSRDTDQHFRG